MKKSVKLITILFTTVIVLTACKKDNDTITGDWNLTATVNMDGEFDVTATANISVSDETS